MFNPLGTLVTKFAGYVYHKYELTFLWALKGRFLIIIVNNRNLFMCASSKKSKILWNLAKTESWLWFWYLILVHLTYVMICFTKSFVQERLNDLVSIFPDWFVNDNRKKFVAMQMTLNLIILFWYDMAFEPFPVSTDICWNSGNSNP